MSTLVIGLVSTLVIEKGNYISRIWLLHKEGANFDVLANLTRRLPDGLWTLSYRFRYYKDNKAFDSADKKSFWSATFPETIANETQAVEKVQPIIDTLVEMTELDCDTITVESDEPKLVIDLIQQNKHFFSRYEGVQS